MEIYKNFSKILMESGGSMANPRIWIEAVKMWLNMGSVCKDSILENPKFVKMIDDKVNVDAVVSLSSCGYFLSHLFDSPLILFSPAGPFSVHLKPGLGNPINPMVHDLLTVD